MFVPVDKVLRLRPIAQHWLATIFVLLMLLTASAARAADDSARQQLQACLKKADRLPDIARADAEAWLKRGGGDAALLCRATAAFHSGEFAKSAADFTRLAETRSDAKRAALLHAQAGLAWMRAKDYNKSEDEYGKALALESQNPEFWVDRATERGAAQRYWDAIDDLNAALKIMPDMPEALRLRGDVWFKLGLGNKAEEDFRRVAEIEAEDDVAKTRPQNRKK